MPTADQWLTFGQDANGCTGVDSIVVTTSENGYVFTPSAFSPNGDGKNDVLRVQMSGYNFRSFSIFNRLGNRVFYSERLQHGWDGKYKNNPAPIDTYFWMLNAKNDQGGDEVFKGDVVLVR